MMGMGHFLPSTPTMGLEITLGFPPLDLLAKEEAAKAVVRTEGRNPALWDGIGDKGKRGHIFLAQTSWGEKDMMPAVFIWENRLILDMESLSDGSPYVEEGLISVSYTHLTLPTNREV